MQPLSNRVTTLDKNLQAAVVQVGDTLDGVNTRLEAAEIRITNLTSLTDTLQNTVNDLTTQLDDTDITVNSLVSETTNHAHRITILEADSAEALNQTAGLAAAANTTIAATNTLKQDVYQIFSILTTLSNDDTASKRQLANLTTRMVWAESNYTSLNNFTTWMYNLLIPVSQNLTATTAVANSAALLSQNLLTRVVVLEATASFTSDRCVSSV